MSSPYVSVGADGRYFVGKSSHVGDFHDDSDHAVPSEIADEPAGQTVSANGSYTGVIDFDGDTDPITVSLVAGQTYLFSLRGTGANFLSDPLVGLFNPSGTLVAQDDDGGIGTNSFLNFTATVTGDYTVLATSFNNGSNDVGQYTVDVRTRAADAVGNTNATAGVLNAAGATFGFIETLGDVDRYAVTLQAGQFYTFSMAGGTLDANLVLRNAAGTVLVSNTTTAVESSVGYFAQTSGTYYLDASGRSSGSASVTTGGYIITSSVVDPASTSPLEALNWDSANNIAPVNVNGTPTAYVYFAPAGQNFDQTAPDGSPMVTYGWNQKEMSAVMSALEQYTPITGIEYEITTDLSQATFRLLTTANTPGVAGNYGAYFFPQDPAAYGDDQGIGVFNVNSGGWDKPGVSLQDIPGDQVSLDQGGFSYAVILHEFGHAHGVAHPHDRGGGSEILLGVTGATGSLGVYNLNQGVYTVMSYNDAWQTGPDGPSPFTIAGIDNGWSGTLSAFDIAVLQNRYGRHAYNTGNNVYTLTDVVDDAFYQTIWDTGGTDTIAYNGALNASIDLLAATLDYSPTGGGVVSYLDAPSSGPLAGLRGGYTIANGVVIENATGGSGNDTLLGNAVANVLTGNAGNDVLIGRGGGDTLDGGAGSDIASYVDSTSGVTASLASMSGTGGDAAGDRYISIEALTGSNFADTFVGGRLDDILNGLGGNDSLSGGNGNDTLNGGAGNDTLDGGNDNDTLNGDADDDLLNGGNGLDLLNGGDGNDTLNGGNDNDTLNGGAGNDTLDGGNGVDILNGGAGDDTLRGGNGVDRFVFTTDSFGGTDTISGYERGEFIEFRGFSGLDASDVSIVNNRITVDLDGDGQKDDLTIIVQGATITLANISFVNDSQSQSTMMADVNLM